MRLTLSCGHISAPRADCSSSVRACDRVLQQPFRLQSPKCRLSRVTCAPWGTSFTSIRGDVLLMPASNVRCQSRAADQCVGQICPPVGARSRPANGSTAGLPGPPPCSWLHAGVGIRERGTIRRQGCRRKRATNVTVRLSLHPGHSDCKDARAVEGASPPPGGQLPLFPCSRSGISLPREKKIKAWTNLHAILKRF